MRGARTTSNVVHAWVEHDIMFKFVNLHLILIHDLQNSVDNYKFIIIRCH
jgi:hypothetical protein